MRAGLAGWCGPFRRYLPRLSRLLWLRGVGLVWGALPRWGDKVGHGAFFGELAGNVAELDVADLAGLDQQLERLVGGHLEPFHQDPSGLADQITELDGVA